MKKVIEKLDEGNLSEEEEDKEVENNKEKKKEKETRKQEVTAGLGKIKTTIKPTTSETLEEITEQQETEADNFSEFMLSSETEVITPTLPTSFTPSTEPVLTPAEAETTNLEESAASAIGTPMPTATTEAIDYVARAYNEPDYTGGMDEERVLNRMSERGMAARTPDELRNIQPRVIIEDWHEVGMSEEKIRGENLRDYVVMETGARTDIDKRRLPFEQQRKYRTLKRGKHS